MPSRGTDSDPHPTPVPKLTDAAAELCSGVNASIGEMHLGKIQRRKPQKEQELPPTVINPALFRAVECVCRDSLLYSGNQTGMRSSVISLIGAMRLEADRSFGHDTPDVRSLAELLIRTDPAKQIAVKQERPASRDPIDELFQRRRLSVDDCAAAMLILRVWRGWGRFLTIGMRSYESKSSSARAKALNPISVMGGDLLNEWHYVYRPWYEIENKKMVARRNGSMISSARIVLHVVTIPVLPGVVDISERLERGTSFKALKSGLSSLAEFQERGRGLYERNDDGDGDQNRE